MNPSDGGTLPDPYRRAGEPWIGPAPVPVVDQVFWIQVAVPPEAGLEVTPPPGVRILDRTRPGGRRRFTRIYLRADRGIVEGEVAIRHPGGSAIPVPLTVLTYREDLEDKLRQVPGWDPAARKGGRSYYTDGMIARARLLAASSPNPPDGSWRGPEADAREEEVCSDRRVESMLLRMGDEELFGFLPSWNVPRQCYGNWPCPACGEKIYERSLYYPWEHGPVGSFRCRCPLCHGSFPTNDFRGDDFTGGDHPDDGWGWDYGEGGRDSHAGWVALHHHTIWRHVAAAIKRMAERYLVRGDEDAAHRAALLCARLAYVYPGMDTRWQQVRSGYLRSGRLLLDGNWERTGVLVPVCQAYDAIHDFVGRDGRLVDYLQGKDPAIRRPDDVRALIETCLIQVFGWDWMARRLSGGNMGARERDMAYFAVCADMGAISDRWIEELFTRAYNSGADRGGFDDETLVNTSTREGPGWVCGFEYAYGYLRSRSDMAEILARVTSPRWKARCDLYDARRYPRLRAEFDTWTEMLVAGHHAPGYGDGFSPRGARYPDGVPANMRTEYARAYRRWRSDGLARALVRAGRGTPDPFEPDVWPEAEAHAGRIGPAPPLGSRVLDGMGFVFLESRPGAARPEGRAGIALRYGYGRGHHHHDNLNVELWAHDTVLAPDLGYPSWVHPLGDTTHTAHHNTGMIDRAGQYRGAVAHGVLEGFAGAEEASFAEVSASPSGFPNRTYRRAICLADAPRGGVYLFDLFRMSGGRTRTYCFHGPAHRAFDTGLPLGPPATEPFGLAGVGRPYGYNLLEPRRADVDDDISATWTHDEKDVRIRLDMLGRPGRRYFTARFGRPDAPPIRFLFAEEEEEDGASEFVALWQPYSDRPFIERIERLPVEGADGSDEFQPVGVRVTLAGGRVDTFVYAGDPPKGVRCGGLELQGRFGYWSEQDGRPRCAHLVDGTHLRCRGHGIGDAPPAFEARIAGVVFEENRLTLDRPVPGWARREGRLAHLRGGSHRTAYRIVNTGDGPDLHLDLSGLLFQSRLDGIAGDGSHLVLELPPPIEASRGFPPGYYDGTCLTGAGTPGFYRVTRVDGERVYLDRPARPEDFPDAEGDGRRMVRIYDMGPGDQVRIPGSVYVRF